MDPHEVRRNWCNAISRRRIERTLFQDCKPSYALFALQPPHFWKNNRFAHACDKWLIDHYRALAS
jgi:hypothetical protein